MNKISTIFSNSIGITGSFLCLIHKVVNPTGQILYASSQKCTHTNDIHNHQHVHFSCQKCQTTTCLFQVNPSIQLPDDYLLKEVYLNVTGICPTCNQS